MPEPKCVCEICTCGEHKCAHTEAASKEAPKAAMTATSTLKADFPAQPYSRREPMVPQTTRHGADGPFDGTTSHKADFTRHDAGQKPSWTRAKETYEPNKASFDGTTTTRQDYIVHPHSKREPIRREQQRESSGPGEYNATYASDYPGHIAPKEKSFKPTAEAVPVLSSWRRSARKNLATAPLDSETTSSEYKAHPGFRPPEPYRPKGLEYRPPTHKVASSTEAHDAYIAVKGKPSTPFKPSNQRSDPGKFDGTSTAKSDYVALGYAKRPPMVPENKREEVGKFDGDTTSKSDFKQHPLGERFQRKQEEYTPTTARFEGTSTTRADYHEHPSAKREPVKPAGSTIESSIGDKAGVYDTTNGSDFTAKKAEPVPSCRPKRGEYSVSGEFDGSTTHKSDFDNKGVAVRESMRPRVPDFQKDMYGKFSGESAYKQDFTAHGPVCPSTRLSTKQMETMAKHHKAA